MSVSETDPDLPPQGGPTVEEVAVEEAPLFHGPFFRAVGKRKRQGRDAKILITADHGQTGVGKTACAVYVGKILDTTPGGFTAEKATLSVPEFMELWGSLEPGSALILDEAEQIDARRAMSNENVDASMKFQTHRVRQVSPLLTLPSPSEIDSRIERLADFWINIEARGTARIYEKRIHRIKKQIYYKTLQTFGWPNMDRDPDYQALAAKKDDFINDDDAENNYIRESEVTERVERARKDVHTEVRDRWIYELKQAGIKGTDIAKLPHLDLTSQRVNQIAREHPLSSDGEESPDSTGVET